MVENRPQSEAVVRIVRETLVGAVVTIVVLIVCFLGIEGYRRATIPVSTDLWPSKFVPEVGFLMEPNAVVRQTNNLDYWIETRSNSLGFLDRDPPEPDANACRVAFIGDSFVEAKQVAIKDKFHVLLEQQFNAASPDRKLQTMAFGFSGTGQVNQLPFYDKFARNFRPNAVVLVIVSNDFTDNSGVMTAVAGGWHPQHSPRVSAIRDASGKIALQPIDPDWTKHTLPGVDRVVGPVQVVHDALARNSYAYQWLFELASLKYWNATGWISRQPTYIDIFAARAKALNLDWSRDLVANFDGPFFGPDPLPPAFADAVQFTDFALAQWKARTHADGVKLLALSTVTLVPSGAATHYLDRIQLLLRKHDIPSIDQVAYVTKLGLGWPDMRFAHDGHFDERGHALTAKQLVEYFQQNPDICER